MVDVVADRIEMGDITEEEDEGEEERAKREEERDEEKEEEGGTDHDDLAMYDGLRRLFREEELKQNLESDFVAVLPGVVLGIECKTSLGSKQFSKATKQWARLKRVLEEELGLNWKFIRVFIYEKSDSTKCESDLCEVCSQYSIKFIDQKKLLQDLHASMPSEAHVPDVEALMETVRDLLIYTSPVPGAEKERVADAFAKRHDMLFTTPAESVFFWSPQQYDILQRETVILQGGTHTLSNIFVLIFRAFFRVWDWQDSAPYAQS